MPVIYWFCPKRGRHRKSGHRNSPLPLSWGSAMAPLLRAGVSRGSFLFLQFSGLMCIALPQSAHSQFLRVSTRHPSAPRTL